MSSAARLFVVVALSLSASGSAFAQTDPPELSDPKALEPALRRALDARGGFCKDENHELSSSERRLCSLADATSERCPGFARACQKAGADGASARRKGRGKDDQRESSPGSSGPLGALIGGLIKLIFWAVLVVGIAAMLWAIVSALLGRRRDKQESGEPDASASAVRVPRISPTGTPDELLAQSRDLASAGEVAAAMAVALRALLRYLEISGRLELHPSRTNGEYARSLRRQGYDPRELRRIAAEVEAVEFGGGQASPEAFRALHAQVSKLVQAAGVFFVFSSLFVLPGCGARAPAEGAVSSCGSGASGYSALCETLAARGAKVRRRFTSVEHIADDVERVVVLDDQLEPAERKVLTDWMTAGGTLVVFDGIDGYDSRLSLSGPCGDELALAAEFWKLPPNADYRFRLPRAAFLSDASETGQPGTAVTVRCNQQPFALRRYHGDGLLVAVADQRLPTNAGLAIDHNAALVEALIAPSGHTVELVGEWTGTGSDLPLRSLSRSGLLPWFLQVLVLALAFALWRGSPFGSRREPVAIKRRAFAEHAVALGDAYSRAKASRQALVNFGSWALERLRVRLTATKHGRLSDLAGAVAAQHQVSEAEVMSLVVAVRSAEDQAHDSATESEHLAALRRLAALVKKTGGSS